LKGADGSANDAFLVVPRVDLVNADFIDERLADGFVEADEQFDQRLALAPA
jgi:hypothetical protein